MPAACHTTANLTCSTLYRLSPELAGMIVDEMDLPSLLAWRSSCAVNYAHATAALQRTLTSLINPFLSHPHALLGTISRYSAVIGGEVALAFIHRHQPFQPHTLEIFASASLYEPLCFELLSHPGIVPDVLSSASTVTLYPHNVRRDVLETTQIDLRSTHTLYIRRSSTLSPLSPIVRSICTAMANFVTPHSFGCAYPSLTLHNKSLLSDLTEEAILEFDANILRRLIDQQIELAVDPVLWQQYRVWSPTPTVTSTTKVCWRSHYICPGQGRFFGDRGSLVDFIDPINTPAPVLQQHGSPPFGTAVVWRLSSTYQCPLSCELHDSTLPIGQISTAVILMLDPFTNHYRGRQHLPTRQIQDHHIKQFSLRRVRSTSL